MKVKFTQILMEKLNEDYYNVLFYDRNEIVYKLTANKLEAANIMVKYKNVKVN